MATECPSTLTEQIENALIEVFKSIDDAEKIIGLTFTELYQQLLSKGLHALLIEEPDDLDWIREVERKDRRWIKDIIVRMVRKNILEERPNPRVKNGKVYHLPEHGIYQPTFDYVYTREEIEREVRSKQDLWMGDEAERARDSVSVLQDIAVDHARESGFVEEVRKAAIALANENPVNLLLEMAQWVADDINHLVDQLRPLPETRGEEVRRLTREINFKRIKAIRFFQRLLRFDGSTEQIEGIMDIPTLPQMLDKHNPAKVKVLDIEKARERLNKRILGEHVIEILSLPENPHASAVGTDASVGDINVTHERGSFIPPTPAVLFVASGAMRVRGKDGMTPYWDYDIDPKTLNEYDDLEAAERGYLISPRLRREAITDFRHLRSAAMELRQYAQELRVVRQEAKWHPVGNVPELHQPPALTLLIRDGRIFPLVHRLDDYDGASAPDDVLYGQVVRREINTFQEVFSHTGRQGKLAPIYGATVKSPEFSWFAMLTFWYLQVKVQYNGLTDGFYRPPLNDQAVTHLLFWGLAESTPTVFTNPRNVFVTFRVIRRFSDIAFPSHPLVIGNHNGDINHIVDEDQENDWIEYIDQHIQEANRQYKWHQRGVPPLNTANDYLAFLNLCQYCGVAMFYGVPTRMYRTVIDSRSHFLLPRWELTVDISRANSSLVNYQLERMLAWLTDEGGLVRDESHAVGGFEEIAEGLPLFIPDVVMQSHETVVYTKNKHVPDIEEKIQQLVRDIREGKVSFL